MTGYEALSSGAASFLLKDWSCFAFSGTDRKAFLNGLVTNDVARMEPRKALRACLLTPKGMLRADFLLYDCGDWLLALCPGPSAANFKAAIEKVIMLSETRLEDRTKTHAVVLVAGPKTEQALGGLPSLPWPRFQKEAAFAIVEAAQADGALARLAQAGAPLASPEAFETWRVEQGIAFFGIDADEGTIPLEARMEEAVSFTKGCYMGQETISRVHHLGHINRRLCALKIEGTPPDPGAPVLHAGKEAGRVTSAVASPRLGAALALAMIRVEAQEPGGALEILQGGSKKTARIIELGA